MFVPLGSHIPKHRQVHMKTKYSLLAAPLLFSISGFAQLSFNLGATSDYIWRGVTQTENDPALQGGIDWEHNSGLYLGSWASNVSFDGDSDIELDIYGGVVIPATENLSFDLGYMRYEFLDLDSADEAYLGVTHKALTIKYSRGFEVEWNYFEGEYTLSLPREFSAVLHLGHFDFKDGGDYNDWKAAIQREWFDLDWELAFSDTNLDMAGADGRVALTVIKSW